MCREAIGAVGEGLGRNVDDSLTGDRGLRWNSAHSGADHSRVAFVVVAADVGDDQRVLRAMLRVGKQQLVGRYFCCRK